MRILFVLKGLALLRHYDEVFEHLAAQGHTVIFAPLKRRPSESLPDALAQHHNCSLVDAPRLRNDDFSLTATVVRRARDYLRYHEPALRDAHHNRERARSWLNRAIRFSPSRARSEGLDPAFRIDESARPRLRAVFDQLENLIPSSPTFERFIRNHGPDVVLVTPLVSLGSRQVDFVKSARALGIPTGLLVFSWDNLSNKGVMHERPDRVFVWNEIQRREAIELHGVDPSAVVVTGAPRFDAFCRMSPSLTREAFCRSLHLDPRRLLVVYLASSATVTPEEPTFTERWIEAVRHASAPRVRDAQLVIRPHPRFKGVWRRHPHFAIGRGATSEGHAGVAMMPAKSVNADQALFDALFHADAAVGLNTSAEIEAGLLGTPVYTVRAPDIAPGQTGSTHFRYLLRSDGGIVSVADTLDEHVGQLSDGLSNDGGRDWRQRWTHDFIRPRGADAPVAPLLAAEIVTFARAAARGSRVSHQLRAAVGGMLGSTLGATATVRSLAKRGVARAISLLPHAARKKRVQQEAKNANAARKERLRAERRSVARQLKSDRPAEQSPATARVGYDGQDLYIYVSSETERRWRLNPGKKEPWTVTWLEHNVRPGDVVYDVGANVGVFSLIAAARLCGNGVVVSFEPGYANFSRLCENIHLNRFSATVIPVPLPLSECAGMQRFGYRSVEPGQSRHRFSAEPWRLGDTSRGGTKPWQPMLALSLDEAHRVFGLPAPNLIKLDVDGAEGLVLRGGHKVLQDERLRSVLVEVDPECEEAVLGSLTRAGFRLGERFERKKRARVWYGIFSR